MDSINGYKSVSDVGLGFESSPQLAPAFNWQPIATSASSSHLVFGSKPVSEMTTEQLKAALTGLTACSHCPHAGIASHHCNSYLNHRLTSLSGLSMAANVTSNSSLKSKTCFDSNEERFDLQKLTDYLDNLKQSRDSFQSDIIGELRQLRQAVDNMKNSLQELPIRFADAFAHCLDSVNGRSESASVVSLPEVVDIIEKMDLKSDAIEDGFVELNDKTEICALEANDNRVDKFVFEYNSYIDLDKWLKKD